jgi:D-alanine-D-alanine ligase
MTGRGAVNDVEDRLLRADRARPATDHTLMRIGLIYDTFDRYPWRDGDPPDADAEYEPADTVDTLAAAVTHLGHTPIRVGTAIDLRDRLHSGLTLDAAINIAEGAHSRNREAYAPILLEMAGIPCLGSDALTLSVTLDKAWTKDLGTAAGIPTPPHRTYGAADAIEPDDLPSFPLFVKPRHEGTSKGITAESRVDSVEALRDAVDRITTTYDQDALVERFVSGGGEFTVAVVGHDPPEALPVLQRGVEPSTGIGVHALEHRGGPAAEQAWDYELEGTLDEKLEAKLQALTLRLFDHLDCRDFARADFRVDADGQPWFLEVNPLPTFAPDDTFAIIAELQGRDYIDFLAEIFGRGLRRLEVA